MASRLPSVCERTGRPPVAHDTSNRRGGKKEQSENKCKAKEGGEQIGRHRPPALLGGCVAWQSQPLLRLHVAWERRFWPPLCQCKWPFLSMGYSAKAGGDNSIVLNAGGLGLSAVTSGFFVNPIRNGTGLSGLVDLFYDVATKEIMWGTPSSVRRGLKKSTAATMETDNRAEIQALKAGREQDAARIQKASDEIAELKATHRAEMEALKTQMETLLLNVQQLVEGGKHVK